MRTLLLGSNEGPFYFILAHLDGEDDYCVMKGTEEITYFVLVTKGFFLGGG